MASDASNPPAPDKDRAPSGVTTGPQFDEALQAAEVLLRRADGARVKADRVLAAEGGIAAGAVAAFVAIFMLDSSPSAWARVLVLVVGVLAGVVTAGMMHLTLRARLISESERDEQAAIDIISLLREVIEPMTDTEKWSETQLRLARARLSRFPIGRTSFLED
jgi:hypothetical protein